MTVVGVSAVVAVLCVASVAIGAAVCCSGGRWTWTSAPVGLSAVVLLALGGMRLPGHASTAAVLLATAVVLSAAHLVRRRVAVRPALPGVPLALVVLALGLLPFLAYGRVGLLGASTNDDLSFHLGQAEALRQLGPAASVTEAGYPTGPHAAVAVLGHGLGVDTPTAFTALLLSTPVLLALTALAALERLPARLRILGAGLVGTPYLLVSYVAEGAFKEPLLALCVVGFALVLREARERRRSGSRRLVALGLVTGGAFASFGLLALVWPAATLLALGVLDRVARGRPWPRPRRRTLGVLVAGIVLVGTAAAAAVSTGFFEVGTGRFLTTRGAGGNYAGQIWPFEALGIWPSAYFQLTPPPGRLLVGVTLAVAVAGFGVAWCWRRRELVLLSAGLAALGVYAVARPVTLAYFSGKALVVLAPVAALIAVLGLFAAEPRDGTGRRMAWTLVASAFVLGVLGSTLLALLGAHVRPQGRGPDLAAFRPLVQGERTLYLGRDNFAGWELRGARLEGFQTYDNRLARRIRSPVRKPSDPEGLAVDFDTVPAGVLDSFRYVVAPRTLYASTPPGSLRRVRTTRWHVLWERRGRTQARRVLAEGGAPGRTLDCRRAALRLLSRGRGTAFVRPRPAEGGADAWRLAGALPASGEGMMHTGQTLAQRLRLGAGRWEVSLQYTSDLPLRVRVGSVVRSVAPYLGDRASFLAVARVSAPGGDLTVEVHAPLEPPLEVVRPVRLGAVAAVPVDRPGRRVPLSRACFEYVDWYRGAG